MPHPHWPAPAAVFRLGVDHQHQRFRYIIDDICSDLVASGLQAGLLPRQPRRQLHCKDPKILQHAPPQTTTASAAPSSQDSPPACKSITADMQAPMRSSASTPSLRSRDGTLPQHLRMDNGGNVKVVVRVRAFLPRGQFSFFKPGWVLDSAESKRMLTR